jgi:PAS domain S-box-containing protein
MVQTRNNALEDPDLENTESAWEDDGAFLRALLEYGPDCIYFKDRQSRFRRCSNAVYERLGITQQAIIGKTDFDLFDDILARQAFEDEQEIIRTGRSHYAKVQREIHKDGSESWALTSKMPLRNKSGQIIGTFGTNKDITDLKRTAGQLAYERDLLTSLLENTPDAIYFKDRQSRFVRCSKSLTQRFGRGLADLIGKTDFDLFDETHARAAFEDEQAIMRTGTPVIDKFEREVAKDGRQTWALTSKIPLRNQAGEIVGTFGISKDVTFIKEAEGKLESVHKQLMEASRQAGMAEVATTVLHNVGNVLNSVNISASVVEDKVQHSKTANLAKAAEMLREHASDLADFLANDPKGSKLPAYLATLAGCLAAEQNEILAELSSLRANIEHIKEIVAMQQAYAKVAGLHETLSPADLIEDALRLNAGAFERHQVQVVREYSPTPPILVDKHKVLQILVNLIRNAKYAVDDRNVGDKRMILRAAPGENGTVIISVIDNGVGIASENLTRIFEHGFTTRQNGHGFALHSGALAARDMGGSLACHSAGPGQGAVFTLELPLNPPGAAS